MSVKVVNKYHHIETKSDIYIGRGSIFGNPFTHITSEFTDLYECESREEAIDKYEDYANQLIVFDNAYSKAFKELCARAKIEDINLVCYCKLPHKEVRCHGDIIKQLIDKNNE